MIKYFGHIEDFWSEALYSYVWPNKVSTGQNDAFHSNYSLDKNDLLQGFDAELPNVCEKFYTELNLLPGSMSWTCIRPSNTIPVHQDKFFKLRSKYNVDVSKCLRYLVFLQDWQLGHLVDFKETTITRWKKGDVWIFDHASPHCAANASQENFYTCQINTIGDNYDVDVITS